MWFIRVHPLVKVGPSGEEVRNGVGCAWNVLQDIIKVLEVFNPPHLPPGYFLWFSKILEVFMVHLHNDWVFCSKK